MVRNIGSAWHEGNGGSGIVATNRATEPSRQEKLPSPCVRGKFQNPCQGAVTNLAYSKRINIQVAQVAISKRTSLIIIRIK
jgi:hypothetical protein